MGFTRNPTLLNSVFLNRVVRDNADVPIGEHTGMKATVPLQLVRTKRVKKELSLHE